MVLMNSKVVCVLPSSASVVHNVSQGVSFPAGKPLLKPCEAAVFEYISSASAAGREQRITPFPVLQILLLSAAMGFRKSLLSVRFFLHATAPSF